MSSPVDRFPEDIRRLVKAAKVKHFFWYAGRLRGARPKTQLVYDKPIHRR